MVPGDRIMAGRVWEVVRVWNQYSPLHECDVTLFRLQSDRGYQNGMACWPEQMVPLVPPAAVG